MKFVNITNDGSVVAENHLKIGKEYKIGVVVSVNVSDFSKGLEDTQHGQRIKQWFLITAKNTSDYEKSVLILTVILTAGFWMTDVTAQRNSNIGYYTIEPECLGTELDGSVTLRNLGNG